MPTFNKIFLLENGELTVIQDNTGNSVTFESLDDLMRCTQIDFTGKWYIGYEPDINFFSDSEDPLVNESMIPYQPYENIIANINTLKTRKEDITWGLTGQALIDAQALVAARDAEEERLSDLDTETSGDGATKITVEQIDALLDSTYDHTDFDAATDFASLKTAIGQLFNRCRDLDRKLCTRVMKFQ